MKKSSDDRQPALGRAVGNSGLGPKSQQDFLGEKKWCMEFLRAAGKGLQQLATGSKGAQKSPDDWKGGEKIFGRGGTGKEIRR